MPYTLGMRQPFLTGASEHNKELLSCCVILAPRRRPMLMRTTLDWMRVGHTDTSRRVAPETARSPPSRALAGRRARAPSFGATPTRSNSSPEVAVAFTDFPMRHDGFVEPDEDGCLELNAEPRRAGCR